MQISIRPAERRDVPAVYQFVCLLEETELNYQVFEKIYYSNIADKRNHYLVAEDENKIVVGIISCHTQLLLHHAACVAEIQELYVPELHRNMGVGKKLLTALTVKLAETDCMLLEVTARNKRTATHLFYENAGLNFTHKKFTRFIQA